MVGESADARCLHRRISLDLGAFCLGISIGIVRRIQRLEDAFAFAVNALCMHSDFMARIASKNGTILNECDSKTL